MHKRSFLFIFLFVFFAFSNTLTGSFIADDQFVIVENDFYTSFSHLKYLFSEQYFMSSDVAMSRGFDNMMSSGSVAYRPVLSLTYFIDYHFWQLVPLGYHLTNILLHIFNAWLVYLCFWYVFKIKETAFVASIIFALHPMVSEAVSVIGFRADLVATFMLLLSLLFYLKKRILPSLFFFFLAVFSKESAIILPGIIFAYDVFYGEKKKIDYKRYLGYGAIVVFYLFIYFFVLPNQVMHTAKLMGGSLGKHVLSMGYIFSYYILAFVNPFLVRVLPPVTEPNIDVLYVLDWVLIFMSVVGVVGWAVYAVIKKNKTAFFLSWFLLALLPVSNIILLINPYANRFMYLPVIGLSGLLALFLQRMGESIKWKKWMRFARICFLSTCLLLVIPRNMSYNSDIMLAMSLVDENPENPMGYLFMGLNLMEVGQYEEAKTMIEMGIERGLSDPRAYVILGWYHREDIDKQLEIFSECAYVFPRYNKAFTALGRALLKAGDIGQAEEFFVKSLSFNESFHGYHYLIQVKIMQGKKEEAEALVLEARQTLRNEYLSGVLHHLLVAADKDKLPLDIGF